MRALIALMILLSAASGQDDLDARVQLAIRRARDHILERAGDDGTFARRPGEHALAVLSLLAAGVRPEEPVIRRSLRPLLVPTDQVYDLGVRLMVAHRLREPSLAPRAAEDAALLIRAQRASGGWGYSDAGAKYVDNSCTQYAILGLRSAHALGIQVPRKVWNRALTYLLKQANARGACGYRGRRKPTVSMTVANLSSLIVVSARLGQRLRGDRLARTLRVMKRATAWIADRWSPGDPRQRYYTAYGLERTMAFSRTKLLEGRDWYRDGARFLVAAQNADGSFSGAMGTGAKFTSSGTCFGLLFLCRASRPLRGETGPNVASLLSILGPQSRSGDVDRITAALSALKPPPVRHLIGYLDHPQKSVRTAAWRALRGEISGVPSRYDPTRTPEANADAIAAWKTWLRRRR